MLAKEDKDNYKKNKEKNQAQTPSIVLLLVQNNEPAGCRLRLMTIAVKARLDKD